MTVVYERCPDNILIHSTFHLMYMIVLLDSNMIVFYQTRINILSGISFRVRIKTLPHLLMSFQLRVGLLTVVGTSLGSPSELLMKQGAVSRQHKPSADSGKRRPLTVDLPGRPLHVRAAEYGPRGTHLSSVPPGDAGTGRLDWEICRPSCSGGRKCGSASQNSGTETWTSSG